MSIDEAPMNIFATKFRTLSELHKSLCEVYAVMSQFASFPPFEPSYLDDLNKNIMYLEKLILEAKKS